MCGIAGLVNLAGDRFDPRVLKAMGDAVAHRGPDDAGYLFIRAGRKGRHEDGLWLEVCDDDFRKQNEHLPPLSGEYARRELASGPWDVAFAHRRLAIIDLTHYGHQPMCNADRSLWMVYNGEVYNFGELREELAERGHHFRSRTDSEVVLHLYEEEGDGFVERLNGMFALAIWDRRRNRLVCARDRYGIKPFYFHAGPRWFVFGSEIKAVLASGVCARGLNAEALPEYLTFQNMLSTQTLFEDIHTLKPGHLLTVELDNGPAPRTRRYWSFDFSRMRPSREREEPAAAERLAGLLETAVRRQLVADVEVGSYLSGGMDSGSIVAYASRLIPRLYTFTNGFDLTSVSGIESGFDERARAERLASRYQTEHYEMVIHAGDMAACLPRLVWHLEDLRVGNCYQNYYAAKLASRFVKVCLSGAGGDELLGGYPWRYAAAGAATSRADFDDHYYRYWQRLIPDSAKPQFFGPAVWDRLRVKQGRGYFDELLREAPGPDGGAAGVSDYITRALWFELNTFLPGILCVEDRVSMSHSLEVRVPFLDNDLVDFALTVPNEYRIAGLASHGANGFRLEAATGKQLLRTAMAPVLPGETVAEKKQGFSPPDDNWYRGPNLRYIQEILLDERTLSRGWFAPGELRRVVDEHCSGRANHRLLIWSMLCLEWMQRLMLDRGPGHAESPP